MALQKYRAKRDFSRSPEPAGQARPGPLPPGAARFVIQKHAARRLHYDLRLEMQGVLKSWAVPKGIPLRKAERRLAVQVEDHPLEYAQFEGIIPAGNYGAGTVMVWDTGHYEMIEQQPDKLRFELHGRKLQGTWTLVRMKRSTTDWLLVKSATDAPPLAAQQVDASALTDRSLEQIGAARTDFWHSHPAWPHLPAGRPRFLEPMKARAVDQLPEGEWLYELKFDGVRALALKRDRQLQLYSRNRKALGSGFGEIVAALQELPCAEAVIDGEIVALDEQGRSSFQLLQPFIHGRGARPDGPPIAYYMFDLLNLDGRDLMGLDLATRKQMLEALLPSGHAVLRFSASFAGQPAALLREVGRLGLEGVVAKRVGSRYEPGKRSGQWLKIKCTNQQEFVIGGYTPPRGTRPYFGALVVGYYEGDKLLYASKIGTGLSEALLRDLHGQFQAQRLAECPFANLPSPRGDPHGISASQMRQCGWIKPTLVCQVQFTEWTQDAHLRHPVFLGLRPDKDPRAVVREPAAGGLACVGQGA